MPTPLQPPSSAKPGSMDMRLLLAVWAVMLIGGLMFYFDRGSILARVFVIIGSGIYIGGALWSGKLIIASFIESSVALSRRGCFGVSYRSASRCLSALLLSVFTMCLPHH